jgi:hypothetical protein
LKSIGCKVKNRFYNSITLFYRLLLTRLVGADTFVASFIFRQKHLAMSRTPPLCLALLFSLAAQLGLAQERFTSCAAAFLDGKMVVDEYSPTGKCSLAADATGELTVCTADLSPTSSIPVDKIKFRVAVRDGNSKTLWMYSGDALIKLDIRKVLAKCKKGDAIVLLTLDDRYALPHNEILVK